MKALVLLSGGLDSTVALYQAISKGYSVEAISFNYDQRHVLELDMAANTCLHQSVPHKMVDISFLHDMTDSSLTHSKDTPHGHYEEESMKDTVVAGRNLIMASIALSYCVKIGADYLILGVHAGDHAIYADCRPEFIYALDSIARVFDEHHVTIQTPFLYSDKTTIVHQGILLGVDFNSAWTCYDPQDGKACGKCGSCQERLEAFKENSFDDPIEYVSS